MPRKDGTGPNGTGPKKVNQGVPTPRGNGTGQKNGFRRNQNIKRGK
jgi:hypothetical protein